MTPGEMIPGTARRRGAKLIAGAVALYLILRLVGFHKLFENDAEGIGTVRGIGHEVSAVPVVSRWSLVAGR